MIANQPFLRPMPGWWFAVSERLTDEDVDRLRELWTEGWTLPDLAAEFGVTPQHCGRLVRAEQRAVLPDLDDLNIEDGAVAAVETFLRGACLRGADEVLVATARALAKKLDGCGESSTAAAAQAVPRIAAALVAVVAELQGLEHEPDALDALRARRHARRAQYGYHNGNGPGAA